MLVWNAISSMVLMILAMSSLDILISFIAALMACHVAGAASAACGPAGQVHWPWWRFPAFRLVMPDISSSEALVSSSEAACSLAPLRERLAGCGNLRGGTGHLIRAAAQRPAERTQFLAHATDDHDAKSDTGQQRQHGQRSQPSRSWQPCC